MDLEAIVLLASNVAFVVVFAIFVVAFVVLTVIVLVWAVRRDRPGREAWRRRMIERAAAGPPGSTRWGDPAATHDASHQDQEH